MEAPTITYLKVAKRVSRYVIRTLDYGLFYLSFKDCNLLSYNNYDWGGDAADRKSMTNFSFSFRDVAYTRHSKK